MGNDKVLNRSYAVALILAILRDGAKHGYNISQEAERLSDSRISFNDGTLYPLLRSLEEEGLIASEWEQPKGERKRRIYKILPGGLAELERQIDRWREFSNAVEAIFEGSKAFYATLLGGQRAQEM